MTPAQASLFLELIVNAGWSDDADELLGDMLDNGVPEDEVREKAKLIDATITEANAMVDSDDHLKVKTEATLDKLLALPDLSS